MASKKISAPGNRSAMRVSSVRTSLSVKYISSPDAVTNGRASAGTASSQAGSSTEPAT